MTSRTVAIMQPTYLPWVGYLDMIDQCDVFVFYDCVQFDKRSWQQRNRVKTPAGETWLTVPVLTKGRRDQKIRDVEIDPAAHFYDTHLRTLRHAYGRAPHVSHLDGLTTVLQSKQLMLEALNVDVIAWMCSELGIQTPVVRSSSLEAQGDKVTRLLSVCRAVGATRYLSPQGAHAYIDLDNRFAEEGIELAYHSYAPIPYGQLHGEFLSHLSAMDLMLNEGPRSAEILRAGRRPMLSHGDVTARVAAASHPSAQ